VLIPGAIQTKKSQCAEYEVCQIENPTLSIKANLLEEQLHQISS